MLSSNFIQHILRSLELGVFDLVHALKMIINCIGVLIIKEVVQQGRVNEMIPPPQKKMKQWH